ncbi:ABC transporter permease [Fulvivirga lutea]|uniref:ABC transporter permease n=1 Tax=Fulvivirga lutea TaxID=2810512 RepID=A0A975A1X2_9BACT|nr:ABC transporter permease [Fulvivirga lutea]QSE98680.1 ABC transporter permease [Fulvivirga lutea]
MFDIDKAIKTWLRSFRKHRAFDDGTILEMELHIRDHIDDLEARGYNKKEAFDLAVSEFGEISPMADEEFSNIKSRTTLKSLIQAAMFKNYSKVAIRNLMRNPLNSFINLFGLSVGIGLVIFVYAYIQFVYKTDQFHENKDKVYLVTFFSDRDGSLQQFGKSPEPLAEMLKNDFTNIEKVSRIEDRNVILKLEDNVFHETVRFTDSDFLEMLTFPMKWGTSSSLNDINSIILSENMSIKYFGGDNPIGRDIKLKFDETTSKVFKVSGVAKKFPESRTISFNFLVNIENLRNSSPEYDFQDWNETLDATLIQVDDPSNISSIQQRMEKYKHFHNSAVNEEWVIASFGFEPLTTLHLNSHNIRDRIVRGSKSNIEASYFLSFIAGAMLLLACLNYVNIAIVSATRRLKEIGVRKTVGASRKVVIVQFLTENIVITSFALAFGVLLGAVLFIPWFEEINGFNMGFTFIDPTLWIYLPAVLLFTAILSGSYPAFYISSLKITGILKGSVKFGSKNRLTKLLLGFQLILAYIFITAAVTFTLNTNYLSERSWGYDNRQVLYISIPDDSGFEKMKPLFEQNPNVLSVSGAKHHLGKNRLQIVINKPDRQFEVDQFSVGDNYFETMGIDLLKGRVFNEDFESDKTKIIVNETFVNKLSLTDPIDELFKIDSVEYTIIGLAKDVHSDNFGEEVQPTIFKLAEKDNFNYLSMKVRPGSEKETYEAARAIWAQLYPEIPFDGGYQEDVWGNYYERIDVHAHVWQVFAVLAILLASMGLYGLITLNVTRRIKEFSIRKVLGAGIKSLTSNISKQYVILLSIATVIGAPVSFYIMRFILNFTYSYHLPMSIEILGIAITILSLVLLLIISTQIRKINKSNPVNGLRIE